MPKRYKHLFEQVVSLENLFAAARKAMRGGAVHQESQSDIRKPSEILDLLWTHT